jgi:hypothetical protein
MPDSHVKGLAKLKVTQPQLCCLLLLLQLPFHRRLLTPRGSAFLALLELHFILSTSLNHPSGLRAVLQAEAEPFWTQKGHTTMEDH